MAFATVWGNGDVMLFPSESAARAFEDRCKDPKRCIVACAEVDGSPHWRGRIPTTGVRFSRNDQSTAQLVGACLHDD